MKLNYLIIILFILLSATKVSAVADIGEPHLQSADKHVEMMDHDFDFDSTEFAEVASYQIVSPSKKGYFIVAILTATVWVLFVYLIKGRINPK